ncbi:MAG: glycine--tRNA ligase subunit beta [Pseudomonadota bacterium]
MPQLLLELFSEEIPARMQAKAEADLLKAVTTRLAEAGLSHGEAFAWSGPRRLGVCVEDLAPRSDDVREERKGPKVGAPDKAVEGFLRGADLASIDAAEIRTDPKKGEVYVAVIETPGRDASEIIAEIVPDVITSFHWPKSMRWGPNALTGGTLRWVRPLQRILCVLGGKAVPFTVDGIPSGDQTEGHRVHGRGPFTVTGWDDYQAQLETDGHVRLRREDRKALIAKEAAKLCKKAGLELVPDEGLLEEVTGLAEWPVVILGDMDPDFLTLPPEVIRLSMRTHQKYFAARDPETGDLAPHFLVVANIKAKDRGKTIAAGNAKVLSARLDDARFFYDNDVKTGLDAMAEKLGTITFKEELGTIADKVERVAALARELAPSVRADPDLAGRAARLCKADLVSEMVYEFPELQGVMGRYYALEALNRSPGLDPGPPTTETGPRTVSPRPKPGDTALLAGLNQDQTTQIADAIADHYKPQGPSDAVPTSPVSIAVALADKLDTLVGFWRINEKPTGSKDPFALRRAALGVVRSVLENDLRLNLRNVFNFAGREYPKSIPPSDKQRSIEETSKLALDLASWETLLAFFADRLKQVLRDEGKRHDLIDAVFALGEDDLVLIVKRVDALTAFLATDDGANLLAAYKRASNILKIEEKKDKTTFTPDPDPALLTDPAERDLHAAIETAQSALSPALAKEDFEAAMSALALLRAPADAFFEAVRVNADDPEVRANRLKLLAKIRDALHSVADFSKIEA